MKWNKCVAWNRSNSHSLQGERLAGYAQLTSYIFKIYQQHQKKINIKHERSSRVQLNFMHEPLRMHVCIISAGKWRAYKSNLMS